MKENNKKSSCFGNCFFGIRRRPTLPGRVQPSTIGAEGLNFCVRDGNRWIPFAITTGNLSRFGTGLPLPVQMASRHPLRFLASLRSLRTLTTAQCLQDFCLLLKTCLSLLKSSPRPISISKLTCYHAYTADLSPGSLPGVLLVLNDGSSFLKGGFTLRCLQRLSLPHFASLLCPWQNNSCTSGASIPVLSY